MDLGFQNQDSRPIRAEIAIPPEASSEGRGSAPGLAILSVVAGPRGPGNLQNGIPQAHGRHSVYLGHPWSWAVANLTQGTKSLMTDMPR